MSVGIGSSAIEGGYTLLFRNIITASGHIGNAVPRLYTNVTCSVLVPKHKVCGRGEFYANCSACFTVSKEKGLLKKILTHPCIIAVFLGLFIMLLQIPLPRGIEQTIRYAGNANTALSMIVIGNILAEVKASEILDKKAWWFCLVRLAIIPVTVFLICSFAGIDEMVKQVSVVLSGMPAAATTAILAAKYDGDTHFAAKIVFLSTLLSMLSVPLLCMLMN